MATSQADLRAPTSRAHQRLPSIALDWNRNAPASCSATGDFHPGR